MKSTAFTVLCFALCIGCSRVDQPDDSTTTVQTSASESERQPDSIEALESNSTEDGDYPEDQTVQSFVYRAKKLKEAGFGELLTNTKE